METEDQAVLWERKADKLQQFLQLTKKVSALLTDEMEQERFAEIEACLKARAAIIDEMTEIGPLSGGEELPEAARNQEWLCGELLKQIQVLEEKNVAAMSGILDQYKEKMRSKRQDRDTIGAYSKQMSSAEMEEEGNVLDHLK